jgi:hypothetical protein
MQTLKQGFEEGNLKVVENLAQDWRSRLGFDCPEQSAATRESIIRWLLGNDLDRFEMLNQQQLEIAKLVMEYRAAHLTASYLGLGQQQAYRNLMQRLGVWCR